MNKSWLQHYDPGVPHTIDIPDLGLPQLFDRSVRDPHQAAILYFGKEISYIHLYGLVNRFATGLQNAGIQTGDRVVLALPNIPQFVIAYWALLKIGAIVVLVNPLLTPRELQHQILAIGAKMAIVYDRHLEKFAHAKSLHMVIAAGVESYMPFFMNMAFQIKNVFVERLKQAQMPQKIRLFRELLGQSTVPETATPLPDDPAVIMFTGGVTGLPKPVVLSHQNLIANMLQARAWISDFKDGGEYVITALPLIHSFGLTACLHLAIGTRSTMLLYPRFQVKRILDDMIKYSSGVFPGVPTMYSALLEEVKRRELKTLPMRICISGGAPLSLKLRHDFKKYTGAMLVEGYGLTEASPVTHCNPVRGIHKENSIGLPWPNTEARIVDVHTGMLQESGRIGELQVRGPQVMRRYWGEKDGSEVVSTDGWLRTGDFAYKDTDGYFYIADRMKDVIFYGGESIYPSEIESLLLEHPKIKEAAVVGVDDDYYGQVVKAIVVCNGPDHVPKEDIIQYCSEHLAGFKVPRYIEYTDKLPKNYLGKVLKRQLP